MFAFTKVNLGSNRVMNHYLPSSIANVVSLDLETSWAAKNLQEAIQQATFDARFQQRQMQEKEEKLLRLYENQQQRAIERVNRGSAGSNTSVTSVTTISSTTQGGKVRQMFDERRQKAGIDRSYPLEPLKTTKSNGYTRGSSLERLKNDTSTKTVVKTTVKRSVTHVKNGKPLVNKKEVVESIYNNNDGDESYEEHIYQDDNANAPIIPVMNRTYRQKDLEQMMNNHHINDNIDDEEFPDMGVDEFDEPVPPVVQPKLSNVGGKLPSQNGVAAKKPVEEKVFMKNGRTPEKKTVAPKKETKPLVKRTVTRTVTSTAAASPTAASPRSSKGFSTVASPTRVANRSTSQAMPASTSSRASQQTGVRNPGSDSPRGPSTARPSSKQSGRGPSAVTRDDLEGCRYCTRRFAADRLGVHEEICARTMKKKRKAYDATKHRVAGTELEPYTRKANRTASIKSKQAPPKKSDWRRKHEEFISAIRAAKMAQAHVAKGGKLSDLPPPPPSTNPDYVQCPHCGRRFNETAAQRHIPKCATFQFNKPKQQSRPAAGSMRSSSKSGGSKGTFR